MSSEEETSGGGHPPPEDQSARQPSEPVGGAAAQPGTPEPPPEDSYQPFDETYGYGYDSDYSSGPNASAGSGSETAAVAAVGGSVTAVAPAKPAEEEEEQEDGDDEGMLRMSFMEHLEELRSRIIRALLGIGVAFLVSLIFANDLWQIISEPAVDALTNLGYKDPKLAQIKPMEAFTTVWVKLPILTAIFLASPWVLYQVWAFVAPGLYKRERRWAAPFVIFSAGLFIMGGLFAYYVAFRFGLEFLLGIGRNINILPLVSITEYFDLFVNVTLGIGLVFQLPVLIFFLTLLRIVTPRFLLRNARYAVLIIVMLAAFITPTPDVVNLMLFSVPMCLLYFVGIFAGYLLTLHREKQRFPWGLVLGVLLLLAMIVAGAGWFAITRYGYKLVPIWPFLVR